MNIVGQQLTSELLQAIRKQAMLEVLYSIKLGLKQTIPIELNEHFINEEIKMVKEHGEPIKYRTLEAGVAE